MLHLAWNNLIRHSRFPERRRANGPPSGSGRRRRLIWLLAASLLGLAAAGPRAAMAQAPPGTVGILVTPYKSYRDAAVAVEAALTQKGIRCVTVELPEGPEKTAGDASASDTAGGPIATAPAANSRLAEATRAAVKRLSDARPSVIVASGAVAASLALESIPGTPVLFCTVANVVDASFMAPDSPHRARVAGITTDVAPREQVDWIVKLCPDVRNVGVLHSSRTRRTAEALRVAAGSRGLIVSVIEANKDEFPKAIEALNDKACDAVVMLPDAAVYNTANVQRLLLWGVRQKKAVWAFSANVVKAGALAGLAADTQSLGPQMAELVQRVLRGAKAQDIGLVYPRAVQASINERTADMIGVSVESPILDSMAFRYGKER